MAFYHPDEDYAIGEEPYLIITEKKYQNKIQSFKAHKESLGYKVFVEYVDEIGNTPSAIRTRIISYYTGKNLKYVLLVGSLTAIPFSAGQPDCMTNPLTDIYYTCLDNLNIAKQKDFHPHVFLGRWDVYSEYELAIIMNKTIKSELAMYQYNSHKIASFSGTDNPKLSNIDQAKWVKTDVINASSYLMGQFYDGRYASIQKITYSDIKLEIEDQDNPLWMFLYFGHGDHPWIASPFNFYYSDINCCVNSSLPYQPFGFSFACMNAALYESECFARAWTNVPSGGIGMMASTDKAIIECNKWFSRKLFAPLVTKEPSLTIGEMIANAKERYYYADQVPYRRNHIAKYIYLGDPSLFIHGYQKSLMHKSCEKSLESNRNTAAPYYVRITNLQGILIGEMLYENLSEKNDLSGIYVLQIFDMEYNLIDVVKVLY